MKHFFIALAALAVSTLAYAGERINAGLFGYMHSAGLILGAVPTAATMNQFRVTDPNQSESIRQRLYDHNLYPAAGLQVIPFFTQAIGSGLATAPGSTVGTTKTKADTNMTGAGILPSGKQYLIETIEVYFYPGAVSTADTFTPVFSMHLADAVLASDNVDSVNDVQAFYDSGVLELNVLDKNFLTETPLRSFPPKTRFDMAVALSAAANSIADLFAGHGFVDGRPYIMDPQISLQPAVNFDVRLWWPSAYALPSTNNGRVGVYFDGFLQRAAQ